MKNLLFPHSGPATTLGKISREFAKLHEQIDEEQSQEPTEPDTGMTAQAKASSKVDIDFSKLTKKQIVDLKAVLGL